MRPRLIFWLILLSTIFCIWVNLPAISLGGVKLPIINSDKLNLSGRFPLKLGLDLQGGTELVLQAQTGNINSADRDSAVDAAREVIERRVNFFGVSEAVVRTSKIGQERRILVELPGIKDLDTAVKLVGKTAQLEFREMESSASAEASPSALLTLTNTKATGLTGADLTKAQVTFGQFGGGRSGPQVTITFTSSGAEKFAEITKRNIGKPLAIFLDDQIVSAPIVQQEIIGGNAVINGQFKVEEAKNLAIQLNAGALPLPIKILQQRQIAPTLGAESVSKSMIAGVIGLLTVVVFMIAYYGVYGLIADFALIIYALVVLAFFRSGFFIFPPVTLTLAGIAGLILSIGMAVDANILTFERIKEELRSGRIGISALEAGFNRSWTSIRDSNVSSLITALVLYVFGTSVVRGFAVTLAIGVLFSMFSALVVTRTFLKLLPRFKK